MPADPIQAKTSRDHLIDQPHLNPRLPTAWTFVNDPQPRWKQVEAGPVKLYIYRTVQILNAVG